MDLGRSPELEYWNFGTNLKKTRSGKLLETLSNPELANLNDSSDIIVERDICISQPPLLCRHSPPKPSVAGSVRSSRQTGRGYAKSRLEKEILEEEIAIGLKELEIRKLKLASRRQMLLSYESSDDESSISGYCERGFLPSKQKIEKFVAKVNSEEIGCAQPSMNRPRKGDTAGTRTAAHEMDGGHVNHYATAPTFSLPKIEIDMFSGNPMEFCKFIKAFQMSIADRLFDDDNKLMYLLHYCRGEAKEAIEHCVFLPGKAGYQRAMDILRTQFGRPHDIAQSFMNELLVGGPIAPGDVDALRRLIRKMVNCDLALKQMHYTADLNCSTNLKRIVERLPRHLQQRWAEAADDILRSGSEPEFDHLVSFLDRSVSIASNCYGVIASPRRYGNQVDKVVLERPPRKVRINVVAMKASMACPHCSQTHSLSECEVFRTLSQFE